MGHADQLHILGVLEDSQWSSVSNDAWTSSKPKMQKSKSPQREGYLYVPAAEQILWYAGL